MTSRAKPAGRPVPTLLAVLSCLIFVVPAAVSCQSASDGSGEVIVAASAGHAVSAPKGSPLLDKELLKLGLDSAVRITVTTSALFVGDSLVHELRRGRLPNDVPVEGLRIKGLESTLDSAKSEPNAVICVEGDVPYVTLSQVMHTTGHMKRKGKVIVATVDDGSVTVVPIAQPETPAPTPFPSKAKEKTAPPRPTPKATVKPVVVADAPAASKAERSRPRSKMKPTSKKKKSSRAKAKKKTSARTKKPASRGGGSRAADSFSFDDDVVEEAEGAPPEEEDDDEVGPASVNLQLSIALLDKGIAVAAGGKQLPAQEGCSAPGVTICDLEGGGRDFRSLYGLLIDLKRRYPDERVASVGAIEGVPVTDVIKLAKAVRFYRAPPADKQPLGSADEFAGSRPLTEYALFPELVFAPAQ